MWYSQNVIDDKFVKLLILTQRLPLFFNVCIFTNFATSMSAT